MLIDFNFGISQQVIAFAHYLNLEFSNRSLEGGVTLEDLVETNLVSIDTRAHREGRERGILILLQGKSLDDCLALWIAEHRSSDNLFVQADKLDRAASQPDHIEFSDGSYEGREFFRIPQQTKPITIHLQVIVGEYLSAELQSYQRLEDRGF